MKSIKLKMLFVACALVSGCSDWSESQEQKFHDDCAKGIRQRSGITGLNDAMIADYCDCAFEKVKAQFTYDEFVNEGQQSDKARMIYLNCSEEHFPQQ